MSKTKQKYIILSDAPYIAGQRSAGKDQLIELSEEAARYELMRSVIAPAPVTEPAKKTSNKGGRE